MRQHPDIHLQSFVLTIRKRNHSPNTPVEYVGDGSRFTIAAPGNAVKISGKVRLAQSPKDMMAYLRETQHLYLMTGDVPLQSHAGSDKDETGDSGASASIDIDFRTQEVKIHASLVGLPPIFYWELDDKLVITSDIYLFQDVAGCSSPRFDIEAVRELAIIGYPIGSKTLFKDIHMLPAAHCLHAGAAADMVVERYWALPENRFPLSWRDFLEKQSSAFKEAMNAIDVSNSFLSLTAGMDTRAIFAALTVNKNPVPAFTMSGTTLSLDARTAGKLCKAYDIDHTTVYLDDSFYKELPALSSEACRLSGGQASLSQAHEVFFYHKVQPGYRSRLSGNLGNQVGRGGAENISLRNAGFSTFSEYILPAADTPDMSHWYSPYLRSGGHLSFDFLLEQEIPFSSVGNYCVGNHFAAQQTPYADRRLIECSGNRPKEDQDNAEESLLAMRIKDLRHRFLGEPEERSFQRKFIKETDGEVAAIPINWGGRAKGGVSLSGVSWGLMALADAVLASKNVDAGPLYRAASVFGITGVHEYRPCNRWLRGPLREFALDLFSSKSTLESGLFDTAALRKITRDYFAGQVNMYKTVSLSLDLALAAKIFAARL